MGLPRIKVCGVTRAEDVACLRSAGVDAVGFNFVQTSPRCLNDRAAGPLIELARAAGLQVVAVVMNPTTDWLCDFLASHPVDVLQLHGQEQVSSLPELGEIGVIKALSWSGREEEAVLAKQWAESGIAQLRGFLVDAYAPVEGGGTGRRARWDLLQPRPEVFAGFPLLLAGGLTPDNVAQAVAETGVDGVDTASGVELEPGVKSEELIRRFALAAKRAFGS